jgi:hypothetical protein
LIGGSVCIALFSLRAWVDDTISNLCSTLIEHCCQFANIMPGGIGHCLPHTTYFTVARACHETGLVLVWPPEQLGPACEEFILRHATSMENARQVA